MTGKDLCPPNYHRYREILTMHHGRFLPRVPFEKFRGRIEKITDGEEIEKWRVAAGKATIFIPRDNGSAEGGVSVELQSEEDVRRHFVENFKDRAILCQHSARIPGEIFAKMPRSMLGKSIFVAVEREKKFPLKFANNLRGRLRRSGFTIYKVGGKPGITYISGIRRKFRTAGEVFADEIQRIIDRIDGHKRISVAALHLQCMEGGAPPPDSPDAPPSEANGVTGKESVDHSLLKNLHWLIREGYVAEFEDGTLMATEILPPRSKKSAAPADVTGAPTATDGTDGESAQADPSPPDGPPSPEHGDV
jgi:hypothetical protein